MPFAQHGQEPSGNLEEELLQSLLGGALQARDQEIAEEPLAGPQAEAQQVAGLFDFLQGLKNPFDTAGEAMEGAEEERQRQKKGRNRGRKGQSPPNAGGRDRLSEQKRFLEEKLRRQRGEGQLAPPPTPRGQELPRGGVPQQFDNRGGLSLEALLPFLQQLT